MKTKSFLVVALLFTLLSCRTNIQEVKNVFFNVTFSNGENGKLVATTANKKAFKSGKAEKDSIITFTATPNQNYEIEAWTITGGVKTQGGSPSDLVTKVKITSNVDVRVTFKKIIKQFNVTFSNSENGKLKATTDDGNLFTAGNVEENSIITFTATPNQNYEIEAWTITGGVKTQGGTPSDLVTKVKITSDVVVKVTFKKISKQFNVTFSNGENGKLKATTDDGNLFTAGNVEENSIITFTATPNQNYIVDTWTITGGVKVQGGTPTDTVTKVKITSNVDVRVTFKKISEQNTQFDVTFSNGENGKLIATTDDGNSFLAGKAEKDSIITFTATPNQNYIVDTWTITGGVKTQGGTPSDLVTKVKITSNVDVRVTFKKIIKQFNVTFSNGENGKLKATTDDGNLFTAGNVEENAVITFTATPNQNYEIEAWTITGGVKTQGGTPSDLVTKVKITSDVVVRVTFKKILKQFNVTFSSCPKGTLKATLNGNSFDGGNTQEDSIITFTATPSENYIVDMWTITGGVTTEGGNPGDTVTKVKVTEDVNVKVTFRDPLYTRVIFSRLDEYLTNTAKENEVNHIVIFELKDTDLIGDPSPLATILKKHLNKKVAIKFGCDLPAITSLKQCFKNCKNLVKAPVIPESVTDVVGTFYGCTNLTTAPKMPLGIKSMRTTFFECAELLEAPEIPEGVEDLTACFIRCKKLTKMPKISEGVKKMDRAFNECEKLTEVTKLPESLESMLKCFSDCVALVKAPVIPANVKNIEGCFSSCKALKEVPNIPESIKNMKECFTACNLLTEIPAIPQGVEEMTRCFAGCAALKKVILKCPYIEGKFNDTFKDCSSLENNGIKVPNAELTKYRTRAAIMGTTQEKFASI